MKYWIKSLLFAVSMLSASLKAEESKMGGYEQLYDSFVFRNFEDQDMTLEQFHSEDKLVLVHLWATWCPPCRREMPDVLEFARMLRQELTIIVTAVDESKEVQEDFLNPVFLKYGEPSENVHFGSVSGEMADKIFDYSGLPSSFLFDRNRILVLDVLGSQNWTGIKKSKGFWRPDWWPFSWPEQLETTTWEDYFMDIYHSSGETEREVL